VLRHWISDIQTSINNSLRSKCQIHENVNIGEMPLIDPSIARDWSKGDQIAEKV
jgi:hypothetical protein